MSTWDALDVSLHDRDLREEVDLIADLIVAVNDLDGPLSADEIDELLGIAVPASRRPEQETRPSGRYATRTLAGDLSC